MSDKNKWVVRSVVKPSAAEASFKYPNAHASDGLKTLWYDYAGELERELNSLEKEVNNPHAPIQFLPSDDAIVLIGRRADPAPKVGVLEIPSAPGNMANVLDNLKEIKSGLHEFLAVRGMIGELLDVTNLSPTKELAAKFVASLNLQPHVLSQLQIAAEDHCTAHRGHGQGIPCAEFRAAEILQVVFGELATQGMS